MSQSRKEPRIRIRIKGAAQRVVDQSMRDIVDVAKRTSARLVGPFPLPTKKEIVTVLRSPHVHKKSREQFERREYQRVLFIFSPTKRTIDELKTLSLSSGVEVIIKAK